MRRGSIVGVLLWVTSLWVTPAVWAGQVEDGGAPGGPALDGGVSAAAGLPAELVRLDALHARRDDPEAEKALDLALGQALKASPGEYELLWRASRLRAWRADGATDDRLKKQLGKEGWDLGDRAIRANRQRAEGHYYAASGMGLYSQAAGILRALGEGLEGKFLERLHEAIRIDPTLDFHGPVIVKGRYWYDMPWPMRDLKKARAEYEAVLAKQPGNVRALLFLTEALEQDGKKKEAREVAGRALAAGVDYNPPDGRRMQQRAKILAEKLDRELK
jgi:hypothetical protein